MKNKKVQVMLATTIVGAALVGGCAFNPAEEGMAEVYGPAPYQEEVTTSEEDVEKEEKEQVSENDVKEEENSEEVFAPEVETEVCVYGPAPIE